MIVNYRGHLPILEIEFEEVIVDKGVDYLANGFSLTLEGENLNFGVRPRCGASRIPALAS